MLRRDNGLTSGNGLHLEKDIHPCAEHNPLSNDAISVISPSTLLLPPIPPGCIVNELAGWEDGRTLGQVLSTVKYNQKWTWKDFPLRPNETKVNLHRTWLPLFMKHPCNICDLIFNNEPRLFRISLVTICNSLIVNDLAWRTSSERVKYWNPLKNLGNRGWIVPANKKAG